MKLYRLAGRIYRTGLNRISFLRKQRFEHTYKKRHGFGDLDYHRKIAMDVVKHVPKGTHVLDLGCGYGFISGKLAEKIKSVTGVDISETALATAKKYNKKAKFVQRDVIDFCQGSYDLILCVGTLPYIPEKYAGRVAENIDKMLVTRGKLVIFEKVGYTGTRIRAYLEKLGYPFTTRKIKIAGMAFTVTVVKKRKK